MEFKIREEKPKIAIDVDGTIAKTAEALLEELKNQYNEKHDIEEIDDWESGVEKVFGGYKKFFKIYNEVWENKREKIEPYVSKEHLLELSKYYDIVIVSNRVDMVSNMVDWRHKEFIQDWIKQKFGLELKVELVKEMTDKVNNGNYDLIIDDAPMLVEAIKNNKKQMLILVERPWNKKVCNVKNENVTIVKSTEEAIEFAIKLRKEQLEEKRKITINA
jgi:hypothetical protein